MSIEIKNIKTKVLKDLTVEIKYVEFFYTRCHLLTKEKRQKWCKVRKIGKEQFECCVTEPVACLYLDKGYFKRKIGEVI